MDAAIPKLPFWRLNNPFIQNLVVAACIFCNPALYLAITLLGAGGGRASSADMSNISNGVLYGVFAVSALFAGSVLNTIGPRFTMMFGITGYPVYIGAMWYYDTYGHMWYPIMAGAYLGLTAGCIWTIATYTANAYAEETEKGLFRAIQWMGNMGGSALGAAIALGISWHASSLSVPHTVYIIFIVIQCCSICLSLLLLPPERLRRSDGTALASFPRISMWESLKMTMNLFKDWRIILMIPACFSPEMFLPFQSSVNAYAFNLRTRTLNSLLNNLIQIPVSLFLGYLLDSKRVKSRKTRAFMGITFDAVWIIGAYIAQTIWLASWKFNRSVDGPSIDCTDASYAGAVVIYMVFAAQYGISQNLAIYILGTFTNDPYKSATIAGLFVFCLCSGTAVSFGVDATAQPYENENAAYFALSTLCWPMLYYVVWKYTSDTNYLKEDTVISPLHAIHDQGLDGVAPSSDKEADVSEYPKSETQ